MDGRRKMAPAQPGLFIGCAGWSIPKAEQWNFQILGSHLESYATRFSAVEINSSFYRTHRPATYARWRDSVPPHFRFSVKMPKTITHILRLRNTEKLTSAFLEEVVSLKAKLGCLLVQLPPSLAFNADIAGRFFRFLRANTFVPIACEPRHASWFALEADDLWREFEIARVAADPAIMPGAVEPGGAIGVSYYRFHGSPETYYSSYTEEWITSLAIRLGKDCAVKRTVWCIFDNTALGAATRNALDLLLCLGRSSVDCGAQEVKDGG